MAAPPMSTLPTSTLQRLAGAIAVEAGALAASQSPLGQPLGGSRSAAGGPVKMLVLRLQPETLGTVTVRLRLVGNALELQLQAASIETAELLQRDRGALEECLKASGYDTDLSAIQAAPRDAARLPVDPAGGQASSGRQDTPVDGGFRQGHGEQPPGRGGDGDDRPPRPAETIRTKEANDETRGQGDRPGGLYL
jgi:chemotaxis protein MotD